MAAKRSSPSGLDRSTPAWETEEGGKRSDYESVGREDEVICVVPFVLCPQVISQPAACSLWVASVERE